MVTEVLTPAPLVRRLTHRGWRQYFDPLKLRAPKDEWAFERDGVSYRVLNNWNSGMRLLAQDKIIAENKSLFPLNTKRPMLTATAVDEAGCPHQIDIFVRALVLVDIRVTVDGSSLTPAYV